MDEISAEAPKSVTAPSEPAGFPRVYAAVKWTIVLALTCLAIVAAAFWALVLGGFAASGFHAADSPGQSDEDLVVTPECAWPYSVNDPDAKAVCRMFYRLTPEQRARVLSTRK